MQDQTLENLTALLLYSLLFNFYTIFSFISMVIFIFPSFSYLFIDFMSLSLSPPFSLNQL
jgi:hypothetical protein